MGLENRKPSKKVLFGKTPEEYLIDIGFCPNSSHFEFLKFNIREIIERNNAMSPEDTQDLIDTYISHYSERIKKSI